MTKTIQFTDEEWFKIKDLIVSIVKMSKQVSATNSGIDKFLNPDDHDVIDMKYIEDLRTDATDIEKHYLIERMKEVAEIAHQPMFDIFNKMTADCNFEKINKAEYKKLRKRITRLKDSVLKESKPEAQNSGKQNADNGTDQ